MTPESRKQLAEQFVKRLKSFLWRAAAMLAALVVSFLLDNIAAFQLSPEATILIGLILGEISKWLNPKAA